jgi:hypothetical protein
MNHKKLSTNDIVKHCFYAVGSFMVAVTVVILITAIATEQNWWIVCILAMITGGPSAWFLRLQTRLSEAINDEQMAFAIASGMLDGALEAARSSRNEKPTNAIDATLSDEVIGDDVQVENGKGRVWK